MDGKTRKPTSRWCHDAAWQRWLVPAGPVAIAAVLCFFRLGYQSFWFDECVSLRFWDRLATFDPTQRLGMLSEGESLYHVLMASFWAPLGSTEAFIRFPSACFGILNVAAVFRLGSVLFDRRVGFISALLIALNPFHLWYAQDARPYSLLMLMGTLSCLGLVEWLRRGSSLWWWSWVLSSVTAVLVFWPALYLFLFQGLFLAVTWRRHGRLVVSTLTRPSVLVFGLLGLLASLPWMGESVDTAYRALTAPETVFTNLRSVPLLALPYTFFSFLAGFSVGPSVADLHLPERYRLLQSQFPQLFVFVCAYSLLAAGGLRRLASCGWKAIFVLLYLSVPVGASVVLALVTGHAYNARYASPSVVAILLVVALGLLPGPADRPGRARLASTTGVIAVIILNGYALYGYHFNPYYSKVDSRSAATLVQAQERPGDLVVLTRLTASDAFACYYRNHRDIAHIDRRESRDSIAARLAVAVTAVERVWLVSVGPWSPEFPEVIPNVLGGEFRPVRRWEFTGIEVLELIREPPSAHL